MGSVGNAIGSLFGGGKAPSISSPAYDPVPVREAEAEAESSAVRDSERRKLQARRGMSGTLLTSPLGTTGSSSPAASGLLGRSG
ncbi:hypothetical protein [uncultured Desulfovibrio sp.]|uniref:hypothetical protein n=1 Tax=uncultured Desulfovibrio sp. TaxID=167968 RepID=UPI0026017D00|nr:hypothetical protein [uncultured Desulfovibrio sp.]